MVREESMHSVILEAEPSQLMSCGGRRLRQDKVDSGAEEEGGAAQDNPNLITCHHADVISMLMYTQRCVA